MAGVGAAAAAATEYTNNDTVVVSSVVCRSSPGSMSRSAAESPKAFYLLQSNNFTNFHSVHQAARIRRSGRRRWRRRTRIGARCVCCWWWWSVINVIIINATPSWSSSWLSLFSSIVVISGSRGSGGAATAAVAANNLKPTTWVLDHDRIFIDIAWGFVDYVCGCVCRVATAMNVAEVCRSRSVCRQIIGWCRRRTCR